MTPRDMVVAIDWSALPHSYGHDPDVLTVWDAEIEGDELAVQRAEDENLGNLACHQSTISPAAFALVEPLIAVAKSLNPRRHRAIETLACFLSTSGGVNEYGARVRTRLVSVPNPFKPGEMLAQPRPPDEDAIADEREAIRAMRDLVEAELQLWMTLAQDEQLEWKLRLATLWLLSRVLYHPDVDETDQLVRDIYAKLDGEKRESMSWIIEQLDDEDDEDDE